MRRLRLMECQNGSNFKVLTRSNMYFQIIILIIIIVMIIIITIIIIMIIIMMMMMINVRLWAI